MSDLIEATEQYVLQQIESAFKGARGPFEFCCTYNNVACRFQAREDLIIVNDVGSFRAASKLFPRRPLLWVAEGDKQA